MNFPTTPFRGMTLTTDAALVEVLTYLAIRVATEVSSRCRLGENTGDELAAGKKNSGNSSKPPSSDIVKPQKKDKSNGKKRGKRKIGELAGKVILAALLSPEASPKENRAYANWVAGKCGKQYGRPKKKEEKI